MTIKVLEEMVTVSVGDGAVVVVAYTTFKGQVLNLTQRLTPDQATALAALLAAAAVEVRGGPGAPH